MILRDGRNLLRLLVEAEREAGMCVCVCVPETLRYFEKDDKSVVKGYEGTFEDARFLPRKTRDEDSTKKPLFVAAETAETALDGRHRGSALFEHCVLGPEQSLHPYLADLVASLALHHRRTGSFSLPRYHLQSSFVDNDE